MRMGLISAIGLGAVCLSACVSVLPEPEAPDALYRIEAKTKVSGLEQDIIVREPEAPRLVAGQGIVSEGADGGLRLVPGIEWSGSATRQIQLAIVDSFEIDGAGNALLPETGVFAGYELASQIKVFRLRGEEATCEMNVSIINVGDRSLIDMVEITQRVLAVSDSRRDRALALREAGADCADQAAKVAVRALEIASLGD